MPALPPEAADAGVVRAADSVRSCVESTLCAFTFATRSWASVIAPVAVRYSDRPATSGNDEPSALT